MARRTDEKLATISASVAGRGCSLQQVEALGRAADLIDCAAGETLHAEHDPQRWAYLLLDGDVALTHAGSPLAVGSRGAWFPLWDAASAGWRPPVSLTALSQAQLLVFRRADFDEVGSIPLFATCDRR